METNGRYVFPFREGRKELKDLLGGKGANLAEMVRLGLPVPAGFTISTEACRDYFAAGGRAPAQLEGQVATALAGLESEVGRRLGDPHDPLLLSVRSGGPFSMPGMMDTVLNLGLNDVTVEALAARAEDERFAWDAYRRLVQLFGKVVLGVPGEAFDGELAAVVAAQGADERRLEAGHWRGLTRRFLAIVREHGTQFPQDPHEQLGAAIEAVFRSWNGRRARDYRRMEGISDSLGTAVNVQAMVFGNLGEDSGTGVAFSRNPATGHARPYGDWLRRAQGEDVVAGIRMTESLAALHEAFPDCALQLDEVLATLERHYRDLCDVEFTIERGRLFVLQTRVGKRTAAAAVRIAVDMAAEGLISRAEAVIRVRPEQLERLLHPQFDATEAYRVLTTGLAASPGAATGEVCFTADDVERLAGQGRDVILVRPETSPEDLHGLIAAKGVLTSRGGLVSHAAVVARGIGKPAVCGADAMDIDVDGATFTVGTTTVKAGEVISIDGGTGEVVLGPVAVVTPDPGDASRSLLGWADGYRRLGVRANADTPEDARRARSFGAEGIGLCRTEHMFLGERLPMVRRMILAEDPAEEGAALAELEQLQYEDFLSLLEIMDGLPVTVRLLDPPLHEFLPDLGELLVADATGHLDDAGRRLLHAAQHWQEVDPMLGTRGCRLGILKPGLYRMQVRALFRAAAEIRRRGGGPKVEVMIPLVSSASELELLAAWIGEEAAAVAAEGAMVPDYLIGTMIETPRAALTAARIAGTAQFFSFGTNDLTQLTFGLSRDDAEGRIMPTYIRQGLVEADPFKQLDARGVGRLIELAVSEGKAARPDLETGVCGEHGGDPASVRLCHDLGLDYVSCSAYRLPVARLAAAQAALVGADGDSAA